MPCSKSVIEEILVKGLLIKELAMLRKIIKTVKDPERARSHSLILAWRDKMSGSGQKQQTDGGPPDRSHCLSRGTQPLANHGPLREEATEINPSASFPTNQFLSLWSYWPNRIRSWKTSEPSWVSPHRSVSLSRNTARQARLESKYGNINEEYPAHLFLLHIAVSFLK